MTRRCLTALDLAKAGLMTLAALTCLGCGVDLGIRQGVNAPGVGDVRRTPHRPRTRQQLSPRDPGETIRALRLSAAAYLGANISDDDAGDAPQEPTGGVVLDATTHLIPAFSKRSLRTGGSQHALRSDRWRVGIGYQALGNKHEDYSGRAHLSLGYEYYPSARTVGVGARIEAGPVWAHMKNTGGVHLTACGLLAPMPPFALCFRSTFLARESPELGGMFMMRTHFTLHRSR